ncbi:MAG: 2Fe-2S iron-sulfur cluster binding domain-containing protein [Proteobacteria bacterium]|nr:2Fe-2S iron-sulfur cluster binding domain-containing protein [Pseudomonadota bacterium]
MKITVETKGGEFNFDCEPTERILFAALRHGLTVPYECATGTCGTCRGRIMQGTAHVAWDAAPGFARLKRDKGDVLMCQARPGTDCVLRIPADVAARPDSPPLPSHRAGRIAGARKLTPDVMEIEVSLPQPMAFEAGQFVVLEAPGVLGGRAYSMVNFGRDVDQIGLVVKQKVGGGFCDWLFQGDVTGSDVNVFGPLGRATYRPAERRNILCIAGGSGIAGMLSILEAATQGNYFREHSGHVFFGVRALADGFHLGRLHDYSRAAAGKLEITLALSHEQPPSAAHPLFPGIRLMAGMVGDAAALAMAGRYDNMAAFVAGPPPMVDAALRLLIRDARIPTQFIRYDKFA